MAVTKIIPIHATIDKSIDYICNPNKTEDCAYISVGNCFKETADIEFQFLLDSAREQRAPNKNETIGRHLIQSFKPDEVTPEKAHEIGKKLADELLGSKYAYVMTTHVDKNHIHNHFVWCSVNMEDYSRYRSNKWTYRNYIQKVSDRLCKENELSVITEKSGKSYKSYYEFDMAKKGLSYKERLRKVIDKAVTEVSNFDEFLGFVEKYGFEVKTSGKYLAFKPQESERFIRSKTLGEGYTEERIKEKISSNKIIEKPKKIKSMYNLQEQKFQESKGLSNWGKKQNIKIAADTVNLLQEKGLLSVDNLESTYNEISSKFNDCRTVVKNLESEIKVHEELLKELRVYGRTKGNYEKFQKARDKDKFLRENYQLEGDIILHEHAKRTFKEYAREHGKKIPNSNNVKEILKDLRSKHNKAYSEYKDLQQENMELIKLKNNLSSILNKDLEKKEEGRVSLDR